MKKVVGIAESEVPMCSWLETAFADRPLCIPFITEQFDWSLGGYDDRMLSKRGFGVFARHLTSGYTDTWVSAVLGKVLTSTSRRFGQAGRLSSHARFAPKHWSQLQLIIEAVCHRRSCRGPR